MVLGKKGEIGIDTLIVMLMLGLMFYVYLVAWQPIRDILFPTLDNFAYGTIVKLIFQLIPLILGVLVLAVPIAHHQNRTRMDRS